MKPSKVYTTALLFCTAVSAWPSFLEPAELIERGRQLLEKRQTKSFNLSFSADQGQVTTSSTTASPGSKTTGGSATITSQSGSVITGTSTANVTDKATTSSRTQTVFDARDGPGGLSMVTPNPYSGSAFYKISDNVTLGWNYTSCSILPTAIDVLAVASSRTYTLAVNQTVTGSSQAFTWDSSKYPATAAAGGLLTATYTLVVYDADQDVSATARAGYLSTFSQFYFGMYSPGATASYSGISCITCSGAMSAMEKQTFTMIFGMMAITILSFTWFAGAAGLF
ncbi:hypothetical protein AMS68_000602 [Peltaster fructicola]|uniref:DUF7137 domain-containing protein n=1 Tax=Peltaster fructicola TaxID=286661 RepID=A0A6H0XKD4_9PEZI|nr:hypothetical protein AMS68_000602 [Peltaster fructicola]